MQHDHLAAIVENLFEDNVPLPEFVFGYKLKTTELEKNTAFKLLIISFLENDFEIIDNKRRGTDEFFCNIHTTGSILLEPDMLMRLITHYPKIQAITDAFFTTEFRFYGMEIVFDLFYDHKLMKYLRYQEADIYEVTVLFNVIRKFFEGYDVIDLWTSFEDIPSSVGLKILKKINEGKFCLEEIVNVNNRTFNKLSITLNERFFEII
jgi:hypothetical protein